MKLRCSKGAMAVTAAALLAGCAEHPRARGAVSIRSWLSAIQVGVDNKDSVDKTLGPADLHRPVRAQRLVLCVARHQPSPSAIPGSRPDRPSHPLRPGRQCRRRSTAPARS